MEASRQPLEHPSTTAADAQTIFIYDGECPLCQIGARNFRLREALGTLKTLDARTLDPALLADINARGIDLDQGMVIIHGGNYYHGDDALHLMAWISGEHGWLNRLLANGFKNKIVAKWCYPLFKAGRNLALFAKRKQGIKNLA